MTASATAPTREKAERARENSEYVRSLLNVRQPQFAAALEAAARKPLRDHGTVCASSQRSSQPGWALLAGAGRPAALAAGQTCELRVGPEFFYLGSDAGTLTVRRGPAPDGDAVVTMSAGTFYSLLTGHQRRHRDRPPRPGAARRSPSQAGTVTYLGTSRHLGERSCPKYDPRPPGRPRRAVWPPAARARAWLCWSWPPRS